MGNWDGWPLERLLYAFLSAAFLLVWLQVTLFHWRGGFHDRFMWGPVLFTPLLVLAALLLACQAGPLPRRIFLGLFGLGLLEGLAGTLLHLRGVRGMVGGFNLRNLMSGPPVLLAAVYAALAALGLAAGCLAPPRS